MSIQLGSEHLIALSNSSRRLTPMSIQLGSERISQAKESKARLTPMSIQLGSEQHNRKWLSRVLRLCQFN